MSKLYRKKPVVIEAVRVEHGNYDEICEFVGEMLDAGWHKQIGVTLDTVEIPTLEGVMTARAGDYIIKGMQGEFYPCKPDIFEQTYEPTNA